MRSAACCSRQPTSALADLKTAVRTSTSNCWTANPSGWFGLEAGHQLLDFLVLGQEDLGGEVFFLKPARPLGAGLFDDELGILSDQGLELLIVGGVLGHRFNLVPGT